MAYYLALVAIIVSYDLAVKLIQEKTTKISSKELRKWFFILSALTICLFQGLRFYSVGSDIHAYINSYIEANDRSWFPLSKLLDFYNFEAGYVIYTKLLSTLGCDTRMFIFITSLLIQGPIFYVLHKYSKTPLLSVLIYFAFGSFIMTFSGLRQSMSMAMVFLSFIFIKEKKPIKFVLMVALSSQFHLSSIIYLCLYPLYYFKATKKLFPIAILVILFIFVFKEKIINYANLLYHKKPAKIVNNGAYMLFAMYLGMFVISFFNQKADGSYILYQREGVEGYKPFYHGYKTPLKTTQTEFMGLRNFLFVLTAINAMSSVHNTIGRLGFPITLFFCFYMPQLLKNVTTNKTLSIILEYLACAVCIVVYVLVEVGSLKTIPFGI